MPILDVSELLDDPDFIQTISVIRIDQDVSAQGETQEDRLPFTVQAVCVPLTTQELSRMPDAEMLRGGITVYARFPLISGEASNTADIVVVNGRRYTVVNTNDYGAFGSGFVAATCAVVSLQSAAQ